MRVPVPDIHVRRGSDRPTGLYRVHLQDAGVVVLIAETRDGYVGIPSLCPHQAFGFTSTGSVDPEKCEVLCRAHGITYSLKTGEAVENLTDPPEDPGHLKLFKVTRHGDEFEIVDFAP